MAIYARSMSSMGIYHIILRGNKRKRIFVDNEDKQRFVDTLMTISTIQPYAITATASDGLAAWQVIETYIIWLLKKGEKYKTF